MELNSVSKFISENWRLTLKLSTVAISTILGVIGMLNDFKDKSGHLTRWGRLNLLGLVVSSLVGVVLQVADTQEQNEKAKRAQAAADAQLQQAIQTNQNVVDTLNTSQKVQAGVADTLKEQSRLFSANQQTLREVERGFTPLGSHVIVAYELDIPVKDARFAQLRTLVAGEADKFQARMDAGLEHSYHAFTYPTSFDGLALRASLGQKKIEGAQISADSIVLQAAGGWPSQVMTGAPFRLKVWKRRPVLSGCKIAADPDVQFVLATSTDATHQDDAEGWPSESSTSSRYDFAAIKLTQTGAVKLGGRENDNGAIQSPLDLEGAFLDIMLAISRGAARMPDDPGTSFTFRALTLYAGHFTIRLDPAHPTKRCGSDLYFTLPSHLAAAK